MRIVFADTFVWLALVNPKDAAHEKARLFIDSFEGRIITTELVLVEVGDALAGTPEGRQEFLELWNDLIKDPDVQVTAHVSDLMEKTIELYGRRLDKQWSLTDCYSFVVMGEHDVWEALTGDHHFEQAGFIALL